MERLTIELQAKIR